MDCKLIESNEECEMQNKKIWKEEFKRRKLCRKTINARCEIKIYARIGIGGSIVKIEK